MGRLVVRGPTTVNIGFSFLLYLTFDLLFEILKSLKTFQIGKELTKSK